MGNAIPASNDNNFERLGLIRSSKLDEISGLQPGFENDWLVHNDDGKARIHIIDLAGTHKASVKLNEAKNKDWEDLTVIPGPDGPILVIADTGNNKFHRNSVRLVLTPLPVPDSEGQYPERMDIIQMVKVKYPDGSRDCEAVAYDRIGNQILFMTKQDQPPRLYGIGLEEVLEKTEVTLELLGEVAGLRPPTPLELLQKPNRGEKISRPTGLDISHDGRLAAVLTYRSLYLYERGEHQTWAEAFQNIPREIPGPKGNHEEGVAFTPDQTGIIITTERLPAPIHRFDLSGEAIAQPASRP